MIERKYLSLAKAAKTINCDVEDIVHWAAIEKTKVGFPGFSASDYDVIYDENDFSKRLEDNYTGFAFIAPLFLVNAELSGVSKFTCVKLEDERLVCFAPDENKWSSWQLYVIDGIANERLYIRIEEFYKLQNDLIQNKVNKPLSNIERSTLLTIIAALAKEAKVDISKTSKAGESIANITQILGVPISATTIENKLKEIPQALENRAK